DQKRTKTYQGIQYEDLPPEILPLFLVWLTPREREKVRSVCKTWDAVILDQLSLDQKNENHKALLVKWVTAVMDEKYIEFDFRTYCKSASNTELDDDLSENT